MAHMMMPLEMLMMPGMFLRLCSAQCQHHQDHYCYCFKIFHFLYNHWPV